MRVTISKTGPSLNHRVWKIIYLLCFLLGFSMQVKCEATQAVHRTERVQYTWKLYDNLQHWYRTWRLLYGSPKVQVKAPPQKTRSEYRHTPLDAQGLLPQTRATNRPQRQQRVRSPGFQTPGLPPAFQNKVARRSDRRTGVTRRGRQSAQRSCLGDSVQAAHTTRSSTTVSAGSPSQRAMHGAAHRRLPAGGASC
jgi:hypothetical protein